MNARIPLFAVGMLAVSVLWAASAGAASKETARVESATEVVEKIMEIPEKAIPPALLAGARGIAIVPGVIKVGFVVGGEYGHGVLVVRNKEGGWSDPAFVTLASGSVGWQIGAQSTDFVIVFKTPRSIEGIMKGKYTLGADASVAAGPVGRKAEAATDVQLKAEIYSYSRSRGLFAGVSLEGSALQMDDEADAAFYGRKEIRPSEILEGKVTGAPPVVERLRKTLGKHTAAAPRE